MTTITEELLTRKGTITALETLADGGDHTAGELADAMDVADGTARERLDEFKELGLVTEDAALRDGKAVKTYRQTAAGTDLTETLTELTEQLERVPESE